MTHVPVLARVAPIRMIIYLLTVMALAVIGKLAATFLIPPGPSAWHQLVIIKNIALAVAIFVSYAALVQWLERRRASEISIRSRWLTLLAGVLIGSSLMGLFVLALRTAGLAQISPGSGLAGLATELLVTTVTAVGEELLFRVIVFRLIEEMTGTSVAVVLSAALFGLAHAANPNATALDITLLSTMGVLLALGYTLTRNIWLPVGIHMSWNFTEGFVFGLNDSGTADPYRFWQTHLSGPDWVTGGSFGPEGSFVLLGFTLAAAAILTLFILRKKRWRPVSFSWAIAQETGQVRHDAFV